MIGGDPLLAALGDYGGPTQTMPLLPGSPAIGSGTAGSGIPITDERGQPRAGHIDIGAFQSQGFILAPATGSTPQSAPLGTAFANPLEITVTAKNPVEPVNSGIVSVAVTPVGGARTFLSAAAATIQGGRASVTATANRTPGQYTVSATASGGYTIFSLTNLGGSSLSETPTPPQGTGTSESEGPTPTQATGPREQVVNDLAVLRAAIAYADSHPGSDTISFDPVPPGKKRRTIKLKGGPLVLTNPATTTISGPGARRLLIQGDRKGPVFDIEGGSLTLEGLTISGGRADRGGGIRNQGGGLVLTDVVIRGNRARVGGGLYNDGTTVLNDVVIRGNQARIGSGLFSTRRATLTWSRSPAGGSG